MDLKNTLLDGARSFREPLNLSAYNGLHAKLIRFCTWWKAERSIIKPKCTCGAPDPQGDCFRQISVYRTVSGRLRMESDIACLRQCGDHQQKMKAISKFADRIGLK